MKAHLQTQVQSKHDSLKGRICCRWNKTGGGDPARVGLGPNTEFGFEDLSLEGFHAQIILEMASRALVTDVFLLLSFYLFRSLPFPSPFDSSAGCSRGLRV